MKITEATEYDDQVSLAMELMKKEDFDGALKLVEKVVSVLEPNMETLANASRLSAKAELLRAFKNQMSSRNNATGETLSKAWELFQLSSKLDPDCPETKGELANLTRVYRQIASLPPSASESFVDVDVVIVGAGAAGIGCALMLTETFGLNSSRVLIIEKGKSVATTFEQWPKEMRFISPSFNQQGWTPSFDLNSIHYGTSPAFSMHAEHPTGLEYAAYLRALAAHHKLLIVPQTEVISVEPDDDEQDDDDFLWVKTRKTTPDAKTDCIMARYVVWAAGEFQYPRGGGDVTTTAAGVTSEDMEAEEEKKIDKKVEATASTKKNKEKNRDFPGSELCLHNSKVDSWANLPGDDYVIIGGYESGIDACVHLARYGKKSTVLASTRCWRVKTADPSTELAPFTSGRLCEVMAPSFSPSPRLLAPVKVSSVEKKQGADGYIVTARWKEEEKEIKAPLRSDLNAVPTETPGAPGTSAIFETPHPPILCTGFENSVAAAASNLFAFATKEDKKKKGCLDGSPLLTKRDESTKISGVFLVGPMVSHGNLSFCFIYKFRQRFAIVANAICEGLGLDNRAAIAECRKMHMYLDDLSCCEDTCGDVC